METKKEKAAKQLANFVRQVLWMTSVHYARTVPVDDLLSQLEEAEEQGLVKRQTDGELHIFCYTQKCQVNPEFWCVPAVISARGLILWIEEKNDKKHVHLVATPFLKFFNLYQDGIGLKELMANTDHWTITQKVDGSLGIIFWDPSKFKWRVATKASFCSEQAEWATDFLHSNVDTSNFVKGTTYLAEIVYHKNRIVISYDNEGLILLGGYHENGRELTRKELEKIETMSKPVGKPGLSLVKMVEYDNWPDMIKSVKELDGHKEEGVVVQLLISYFISHQSRLARYRIKVKSEEYLLLHKSLTYTDKHILKAMTSSDEDLNNLRNTIPDECLEEFDKQVEHYYNQAKSLVCKISNYVRDLREEGCETKRDVGIWIKGRTHWPNGDQINKTQLGLVYTGIESIQKLEVGWVQLQKTEKTNVIREGIFKLIK